MHDLTKKKERNSKKQQQKIRIGIIFIKVLFSFLYIEVVSFLNIMMLHFVRQHTSEKTVLFLATLLAILLLCGVIPVWKKLFPQLIKETGLDEAVVKEERKVHEK